MTMTDLETKEMTVQGYRIRYLDLGKGPAVVFCHGLGGTIEDNDKCFPYLIQRGYRVVALDCPGTGMSEMPVREYTVDYLADFTLDFIDALGIDKFYLSGGSQGGMHVLLTAMKAPDRVLGNAIYSSSGVWPRRPLLAWFFNALPPNFVKLWFWITSFFWYPFNYPNFWNVRGEDLKFKFSRELPGYGLHVLGCLASQFADDYREIYKTIKTPTLILWGELDTGMPVKMGYELHEIMKEVSKFIPVPGAGHNISTMMPDFYAEQLDNFFKALNLPR